MIAPHYMMRTLLLLACFTALVSCNRKLLIPTNYLPEHNNLNAIVHDGNVTYRLENLETTSAHYIFSFEVINRSNREVTIEVGNFRYYSDVEPFKKDYTPFKELNYPNRTFALSAEKVNQYHKKKIKEKQFLIGLAALTTAVAIIAVDAVQDEKDEKKRYWNEKDIRKSINRDVKTAMALDLVQAGAEIMMYETGKKERIELEYLPDEYFIESTIKPDSRHFGKIYFPKEPGKYFRFILPFENKRLIFDFMKSQ